MLHRLDMIYIVDKCNMKCVYCRETIPKINGFMDIKQFLNIFQNIYTNAIKSKKDIVRIALFGGEPLLNWDLIEKIFIWKNKNKDIIDGLIPIEFFISTNGTLLDFHKLCILYKNKVSLSISFDGKLSNKNRVTVEVPDLYLHILNVLEICKQNEMFNFIKLSWVVTPEAYKTIKNEVLDLLQKYSLVIKEIKFSPLDHYVDNEMANVLIQLNNIQSSTFICPFYCPICNKDNCGRRNEENQCFSYDIRGNQYSGGDSYITSRET